MSESLAAVNKWTAQLLLAEFETAYQNGDFGVIAHDVATFDKKHFLATLPDILERAKVILPPHNRTRSMRWLTTARAGRCAVDVA